jgi:hypothetical protein
VTRLRLRRGVVAHRHRRRRLQQQRFFHGAHFYLPFVVSCSGRTAASAMFFLT